MFDSKDKDEDGRLSFEEFMGEQSRAERLFKLMDKDGDGYVTKNVSFILFDGYVTKNVRNKLNYFKKSVFLVEVACMRHPRWRLQM